MPRTLLRTPELPDRHNTWVATNSFGVPRYWATVWEVLHGGNVGKATLGHHLLAIERLYRSVEAQSGRDCLDLLIARCDFKNLEDYLEGFFVTTQNSAAQSHSDASRNWRLALSFVTDIVERLIRNTTLIQPLEPLQRRLDRLERLYASLNVKRRRKSQLVRALPASVVANLYQLTDPASGSNPFTTDINKWRNYALFLLYLHQGLRRGEALVLPADALKEELDAQTGMNRLWMNVTETQYEENDRRYDAPSIKTRFSQRQIPVAEDTAAVIHHYTANYRGRQNHSWLFPSNRGKPLSVRAVNDVFDVLSSKLSDEARRDLRNNLQVEKVTPHDLRHTCAVVRLSQFIASGMEMDIAIQSMRVFFGWSKNSEMPRHYSRAYFEDRLRSVWKNKFDERVDVLRRLLEIQTRPNL